MSKNCYWEHNPPAKQLYPCIDGHSTVCARCCVERCPVETPELFAACAAAGHPTWPAVGSAVPMKLVCLESSWDQRVFHVRSVKGFLESLAPLLRPPLRVAHRFIESGKHLAHYTQHPDGVLWTDPNAWDAPIFYLAFHGVPGAVTSTLDQIGPTALCEAFAHYGAYSCLVYFGSCSVLRGAKGQGFARKFLKASGVRAVIGYTEDIDWMDSLVVDLLFFYRFYSHSDPWNSLTEIFASVQNDFGPAQHMGLTMIRAPKA